MTKTIEKSSDKDSGLIAVLAGNVRQFNYFARLYPTEHFKLVYVDDPIRARGVRFSAFVIIGTFEDRDDARRLRLEVEYNSLLPDPVNIDPPVIVSSDITKKINKLKRRKT